ncbi:GAP family protein [Mycolicibacterium stellerae]|uniref:GAP family protein n=1 Tax=Mycolicibacterium stellerae TaxID=2358193 RepID=UPI000F0B0C70|nr:GAP family protein [Mycolicibacterium stellerae]
MWGAVLVMALAAMADPLRIGITVLVISRPRPVLQLLAFWIGGVAMGFGVGLGVLFLLRDLALDFMNDLESTTATSTVGVIQITIGVLALLLAAMIAMRFPTRRRARVTIPDVEAQAPAMEPSTPSALSRLSTRAGDAMQGGSLWVAFVAGAWLATPLQFIAALAAILASGASAGTQVVALVAYHVVALASAEIPLLSQLVAPDKTQAVILRVHDWVLPRRRHLIAVIIAVVAIFLVVNGFGGM